MVRLIFDRYVNHKKGDGRVAEYLAKHGYNKITRENGKLYFIDESFVGHVIKNETYCGQIVYGKRKNVKNPATGKSSPRMRDQSEWYRSEGLHAEISSLEQGLREVEDMIANIRNQQISKDNVCKFILQFGKIYKQLTEVEKKEVARNLIEHVEIFPEEQKDGSIIKSVTFRISLKNGESRLDFGNVDGQTTGINVETVVLMSKVDK